MRGTRIWALVAASVAALVLPASRSDARPQEVDVESDGFTPAEVRVEVEETVRWVIREDQHTITSDDGLFDSGRAGPGSVFVARFHNAGRFAYYCAVHGGPGGRGMSGVVVVGNPRRAAPAEEETTSTTSPPPRAATTATTTTTAPATPPSAVSPPPPLPAVAGPAAATSPPPEPASPPPPAPNDAATPTTSATTSTTAPPDTPTTTSPPAPPEAPPAAVARSAPSADGQETRDLYRIDRKALQRRLTASTAESGDGGGRDALTVAGGTLLALAGLGLVVPGWRTRRR